MGTSAGRHSTVSTCEPPPQNLTERRFHVVDSGVAWALESQGPGDGTPSRIQVQIEHCHAFSILRMHSCPTYSIGPFDSSRNGVASERKRVLNHELPLRGSGLEAQAMGQVPCECCSNRSDDPLLTGRGEAI